MKYSKNTHPRLYNSWRAMRHRCNGPNATDYKYYGGKGVIVYDNWDRFHLFAEWALSNGYEDGLTIDRVDPNKNYNPSNCRWITHIANVTRNNKTRNRARLDAAKEVWLSTPEITGTRLAEMFDVSISGACKWIRQFTKETQQ